LIRVREPRPERRPPRPAPLVCEPFRLLCDRVLIMNPSRTLSPRRRRGRRQSRRRSRRRRPCRTRRRHACHRRACHRRTRRSHRRRIPGRSATPHIASRPTQSTRGGRFARVSPHVCSVPMCAPVLCAHVLPAIPHRPRRPSIPAVAPVYAERRDHQRPPLGSPREPTPPVPGVRSAPVRNRG